MPFHSFDAVFVAGSHIAGHSGNRLFRKLSLTVADPFWQRTAAIGFGQTATRSVAQVFSRGAWKDTIPKDLSLAWAWDQFLESLASPSPLPYPPTRH